MMKGNPECQICNQEVCDESSLGCDWCDSWYHSNCLKIPKTVFKFLAESKDANKYGAYQWHCPTCCRPENPRYSKLQFEKLNAMQLEQQDRISTLEFQVAKLMSAATTDTLSAQSPSETVPDRSLHECSTSLEVLPQAQLIPDIPKLTYAKALVGGSGSKSNGDIKKLNSSPKVKPALVKVRAKPTEIMVLKRNTSSSSTADPSQSKKIKEMVYSCLSEVEMCFMKLNETSGKISIGFPNLENKTKAEECLTELNLEAKGYSASTKNIHLPRLTVTQIPIETIDLSGEFGPELDSEASKHNNLSVQRQYEKDIVKKCILQKSSELANLCNLGHTFDIVFLKKLNDYLNIGIKVSPTIREWILNRGFLFIGNSCCPVIDRLVVKQCYHCQQIGHVSSRCPSKSQNPTCLYCMEEHRSSTCPTKMDPSTFRCCNCSNHTLYSKNVGHTSNSYDCPLIQKELIRLQQHIDYTSKNVM